MEILKFITAGNVDDGKSTLIGRLLIDSHAVCNDILENIQSHNGEINLAYLTDGLKAEREQGITIDVAYKFFSTSKRKFIIADCPGHKEYTRNMITGASHADVAIVIIDATKGITEQTKRHSFIIDMMNIPYIIFCINKMDVVQYREDVYLNILHQLRSFQFINSHQIEIIPISALKGDNVVHPSHQMNWYNGPTLLNCLETYSPIHSNTPLPSIMQVQYVSFHKETRYFFGTLINGDIHENEPIIIYPTQQKNIIKDIFIHGKRHLYTTAPIPVAITLKEDTQVQRGYFFVSQIQKTPHASIQCTQEFHAICFWLDNEVFIPHKRYYIQQHAFRTYLKCQQINAIFDLNKLMFKAYENNPIEMNTIFKARFITSEKLLIDDYRRFKYPSSFIIVDETSLKTVGAGIITSE